VPSVSKAQQRFMGIVRSIQKGNAKASDYSKEIRSAAKSMKKKDVKDFADTDRKGLPEERDYKDEYKKFQSSTKSKQYRAELNKYNRKKGTYGNGDGKDASHKGGKIVGFESQSTNRGRAEKSRLKKEQKLIEGLTPKAIKLWKELSSVMRGWKDERKKVLKLGSVSDLHWRFYMKPVDLKDEDKLIKKQIGKVLPKIMRISKKYGVPLKDIRSSRIGYGDPGAPIVGLVIPLHNAPGLTESVVNEELQNSQGEQTDFKKGDLVKDINPDCPHHGSEGEVTKVGKGTITFDVTNNGKNYQEGDELEKTVDQMVKLKESVNEKTVSIGGEELMKYLMKRFKMSKSKAIATMKKHKMDLSFLKKESVTEGSFKSTLYPKKGRNDKIRFQNDPSRLYKLKNISVGNKIKGDPSGTSYMFVASGNRKEYFTKQTWRQAMEKGWLSLESVNEAKIAHSKGGYVEVGEWYLLNYGKWKDKVKVLSIDSKVMKLYNPRDNWSYTLPMKMIKKKKIGGYMTPLQESVNEARSTNTEWNKFEKDYGDFFKTVVKLGKANTKLTGDKTDEKIFLTNFTRNVGKFYTLMKSWKRGQNESVNESIELPQGVEFGKVFTGYGKSFVKEESINEATPKEKGNLKVMKPKFKKTMDKIYKDVASIYQNLGSVEADKLKKAYIAAINRGLNPHTNMFMKHNAQKILDTAFKNESVNEECCGNCKEGKVCCDVHEKISKDEWAEYPKYARKLKPYMKKLLKVPVRVRVIKQANHNPWIEVRVSRFGKDIIPNDFRKRALKAIGGGKPRDMDNITYGNITAGSVSMKHDQWVKLLGNKVKSESVNEARTINVEPNWEGMWRFFKRMAITNPRDWKKMERKLGGEWLKIDKMAQQKGWKSESVDESGILYRAGVKKYGKEGMRKIQQAAGKRKSHAEIGKIKDKYEKESLEIDEGFGSSELMTKKDLAVFEKTRQKNAEVLGYKLTGKSDIKPIKEKSKVTK
jgi:hypothetical protein